MCAAWFFRIVGLRRTTAFALRLLFAFAPYRYMHAYSHVELSLFFPVALVSALIYLILTERR